MNNLEAEARAVEYLDYKKGNAMNQETEQRVYLEDLNPDPTYTVGKLFPYEDLAESWHYSSKAGDFYTDDQEEADTMQELLACLYYLETYNINTDKDYSEIPSLAREHGFVI